MEFRPELGIAMLAALALAAPAAAQPGFAPQPLPQGQPMPQSPEMAKKMLGIDALRQLHAARFTGQDVAAALAALKQLRQAQQGLETQAMAALEEERRALLSATPDGPPPAPGMEKMRQAGERYREMEQRTWESLMQSLGPQKTETLRRILGQMGPPPFAGRGVPPPLGAPGAPGGQPQGAPGSPGQPPAFGQPGQPPFGQPRPPQQGRPPQPGQPPQGQPGYGNPSGPGAPVPPGAPGAAGPGFPAQPFGPAGMPFAGPRLSLPELIELLEQKQAAMRK